MPQRCTGCTGFRLHWGSNPKGPIAGGSVHEYHRLKVFSTYRKAHLGSYPWQWFRQHNVGLLATAAGRKFWAELLYSLLKAEHATTENWNKWSCRPQTFWSRASYFIKLSLFKVMYRTADRSITSWNWSKWNAFVNAWGGGGKSHIVVLCLYLPIIHIALQYNK